MSTTPTSSSKKNAKATTRSSSKRKHEDDDLQDNYEDNLSSNSSDTTIVSEPYRKELKEGEAGTLTGRPLRLYADGIFDLFHFGHAKQLQQCKQAYPNTILLVGCCNDEMTHSLKGRTVLSDEERYESLRHCKWVDEVIESAPWVLDDAFLEKHQIDYVCHDALPYGDASGEADSGDVYKRIKEMGKFLETTRTDGISTSDLIIRIISQYDTFIRRNLSRGYTGKEMNVPFMKEQSIKWDMVVDRLKNKTKEVAKEVVHDADSMIHKWFDEAKDMQHNFLELFSKDGAIRRSLRKRRRLIKDKITDFAREGKC